MSHPEFPLIHPDGAPSSNSIWPAHLSLSRFLGVGIVLDVVANSFLYPLYFCKTHIQINTKKLTGNPFRDLARQANSVVSKRGFLGLYKGFWFSTWAAFPGIITHAAIYTMCKDKFRILTERHPHLRPLENTLFAFISGMAAESLSILTYVPEEIVSQRLILAPHSHRLKRVVREIYKENGLKGFMRGTRAAFYQYIPSAGLWWSSYESFKWLYGVRAGHVNEKPIAASLAGACAGATVGCALVPLDVLRTRIQTQKGDYSYRKNASYIKLVREIVKKEGKMALTKGIAAKVALLVIEGAISADCYEIIIYFATISQMTPFTEDE